MTAEDALKLLLSKLEECEIPYMITGSFASNIHGLPRATQDADVVIEVDKGALKRLLKSLGLTFYKSTEAAMDALAREQMFNVVHLETGFKVDLKGEGRSCRECMTFLLSPPCQSSSASPMAEKG